MEIQGAQAGQIQQGLGQHVAIIARKEKIRLQSLYDGHKSRIIGVGGLIHRQVIVKGQLGNRGEPDIFPGVVGMGDHGDDLIAQIPAQSHQGLQADITDIVVTHEDDAHMAFRTFKANQV